MRQLTYQEGYVECRFWFDSSCERVRTKSSRKKHNMCVRTCVAWLVKNQFRSVRYVMRVPQWVFSAIWPIIKSCQRCMDTYCPVDDLIQVNLKMHFFHFRANSTAATNVSITNILSKLLEKKKWNAICMVWKNQIQKNYWMRNTAIT